MRRSDKEITSEQLIGQIMAQAQVCRLGLCKDKTPYIVPLSFGYDGTCLYFHSAPEGMKIDFMTANDRVCFELEHEVKLVPHDSNPCQWSFSFFSVIGFGRIEEVTDSERRVYALNQIMRHYSGREWAFSEPSLDKIRLWCVVIEQITGKQSKDKTTT
jgi:uncharacterized protein